MVACSNPLELHWRRNTRLYEFRCEERGAEFELLLRTDLFIEEIGSGVGKGAGTEAVPPHKRGDGDKIEPNANTALPGRLPAAPLRGHTTTEERGHG